MAPTALPHPAFTALPATPIERLRLPAALSGASGAAGSNRARGGIPQIAAADDLAAVTAWLARYTDTPATLQTYRREVERLLLWAVLQHGKPLSSLTHEDLLLYERFLADPQPAWRWVMASRKKLARGAPDWRPFAGPLSPASARHAMVILNTLFAWLVDAGYLAGNPLSLARSRRGQSKPRITRYLSHAMWQTVKDTIEAMPGASDTNTDTATERDRLHAARCRWLFTVLYLGGLRAAEVAETRMGAFFCRRDVHGMERWWLEVTGKGNKTRLVPATDELIVELARYRAAYGLPPAPHPGEARPIVPPIIGKEKPLSRGALHLVLKEVFGMAAARLRASGPEWESRAAVLASASAHWLRHTAGSHMTDQQVDLRFVRDNFGHASISTTSAYLHTEDDARHEATQARHRIGWTREG
ncbi:tyrosine-type recombinase/integrase [Cupriavidus sp. UME77]|uniref:tyrosine-type recombinase/integrase n=1 Tax=Cupriavidus sp. UME77 TaxID=1862321 RepID=UPI0016009648|nr:tyrosine-type recombinase/integrase [Cupriavidus sp. UME77]MBB1633691.1 integrase [Cupriavidus sp. UME77]